MAVEAPNMAVVGPSPMLRIQPEKNWQALCRAIAQIAIHLFISLGFGYILYAALPLSLHATILPAVLFSVVFAISFLSLQATSSTLLSTTLCLAPNPLPGIANLSKNCWINSLMQTINSDEAMKEWFSNLPQEWLGDPSSMDQLPDAIRDIPYLPPIRGGHREIFPHTRYIRFFESVPPDERATRWKGLVTFSQFLKAYRAAEENRSQNVLFQSQQLRLALHALNSPVGVSSQSQEDPMVGLTTIGDSLLPDDLKASIDVRTTYHQDDFAPIAEQEDLLRREPPQLGCVQLPILGEHPNLQRLIDQVTIDHPEISFNLRDIYGVIHTYRINTKERHFTTAPPALWFHLIRMHDVSEGRGQPNLQKLLTPVDAEDQVHIQLAEGEIVHYQLDSFIVHCGNSLNSGHYKSYRKVQGTWFEMNDTVVRQITIEEKERASQQAYVYHYSKIE